MTTVVYTVCVSDYRVLTIGVTLTAGCQESAALSADRCRCRGPRVTFAVAAPPRPPPQGARFALAVMPSASVIRSTVIADRGACAWLVSTLYCNLWHFSYIPMTCPRTRQPEGNTMRGNQHPHVHRGKPHTTHETLTHAPCTILQRIARPLGYSCRPESNHGDPASATREWLPWCAAHISRRYGP